MAEALPTATKAVPHERAVEDAAAPRPDECALRGRGAGAHGIGDAQALERRDGVRLEAQPCADHLERLRLLEHERLDARLPERDRRREAADPSAGDDRSRHLTAS